MPLSTVRFRRGTAAEWTAGNPILSIGEPGWETDTRKGKVGNGSSTWNSLPYSLGDLSTTLMWQPSTSYTTGQVVIHPDGSTIVSNATRTSRPAFDATELTFWTPAISKAGTLEQSYLSTTFPPTSSLTVNVRNPAYGATGNGTTDDTTAIQAAVTAAKAAGRTLYFPAGTYKMTSNLVLDWDYATVIGDGANTVLNFVGAGLLVDGSAAHRFRTTLRDLRINRTGTAGPALYLKGGGAAFGVARFTIDNIDVKGSTGDGLEIAGSYIGTVVGSYFRECTGRGVYMHVDPILGTAFVAAVLFHGGEIQSNAGGGVEVNGQCGANSFYGTCIEGNSTFGVKVNGAFNTNFYGCYLETNSGTADFIIGDTASNTGVIIDGCYIDNGATAKTKAVALTRGVSVSVTNNSFVRYTTNPPISVTEASAGAVQGRAQNNTHDGAATNNVILNGAAQFSSMGIVYQASATLDFPSIAASGGVQNLTITVPGAVQGDTVTVYPLSTTFPPNGIILTGSIGSANTVTIRATNTTVAAIDPAGGVVVVAVHHWLG